MFSGEWRRSAAATARNHDSACIGHAYDGPQGRRTEHDAGRASSNGAADEKEIEHGNHDEREQGPAKEKVVLAYSGGLDTSVCLKWLQVEKGFDVIAVCGNVGQDESDLAAIKQKALDMGAIASFAVDMREEYASEFLTLALAANGLYENLYPLLSALWRPLLSKHMVEVAHALGAHYIAHGCTGKGNDQVRFETSIKALDPTLEIVAPVREWDLHCREEEIEWAKAHGVPVAATKKSPY